MDYEGKTNESCSFGLYLQTNFSNGTWSDAQRKEQRLDVFIHSFPDI